MRRIFYLILFLLGTLHARADDAYSEWKEKLIREGRKQIADVQQQNALNDAAGNSHRNNYVIIVSTNAEYPNGEFIHQEKGSGQASSYVLDAVSLQSMDEKLRAVNAGSTITSYLLIVNFVPLEFVDEIPDDMSIKNFFGSQDRNMLGDIGARARAEAAGIVDGMTNITIGEASKPSVYSGLVKFKVFKNKSAGIEQWVYHHNSKQVEHTEQYRNILRNSVQTAKWPVTPDDYSNVPVMIEQIEKSNATYKSVSATLSSLLQINDPVIVTTLLKDLTPNGFASFTAEQRIHALKVLSSLSIPDDRELIIVKLIEGVSAPGDADKIIEAMMKINDKLPVIPNVKSDMCLLQCITNETGDAGWGVWLGDNYSRLIKGLASVCYKSDDFKAKAKALNDSYLNSVNDKIPDRVILYTYNSVWSKISSTFQHSQFLVIPKIDWDINYVNNCELQAGRELFFSYLAPNSDLGAKTLSPFEPIVFENKSDLGMLTDFDELSSTTDHILPAIILKYANEKAGNQTLTDATFAAIDVASLATGYGELKLGITGLRKAWVIVDMVNAGINLTVNTAAYNDPAIKEMLNYYNIATGGISLARIGTAGVKSVQNVYKALKAERTAMSANAIRNFLKSFKEASFDASKLQPEHADDIKAYLLHIKTEAKARNLGNLEEAIDDALDILNVNKVGNVVPTSLIAKLTQPGADKLKAWTANRNLTFVDDAGDVYTGANAEAKLFEKLDNSIGNQNVLGTFEDAQGRLLIQCEGSNRNTVYSILTNEDGQQIIRKFEPAYKPTANADIDVGLSEYKLAPDYTKDISGASSSRYLCPSQYLPPNKTAVVKIEMQGNRLDDFLEANKKIGLDNTFGSESPYFLDNGGNMIKYTWHHLDDFVLNQSTGKWECTMQLVRTDAHGGLGCTGMTHAGAPAVWRAFFGSGY